ncbi:MAG: GntG family PLP-dependent aldolase, partial [Erysipelotrichaceae bacterium]
LATQVTGKEAALFVTSGTQGNLLGVWSQTNRGDEVILGRNSHIITHEVGGLAAIANCLPRVIDHPNDFIYPEDIEAAIRPNDIHEPATSLLCMENALSNGKVIPVDIMKANFEMAKKYHLNVHLDGARLFNAATALNVNPIAICECADTITFCLSKGLCAPYGSMLCGPREIIEKARRYRKMIGGGVRQVGILAAAGIIAIEEMTLRLQEDHDNIRYLANKLKTLPDFEVIEDGMDINMVFVRYHKDADHLFNYLQENQVLMNPATDQIFRFVTHYWISKEDIDHLIQLLTNYKNNA